MSDDPFEVREPANLLVIGEGKGQVDHFGALLVGIIADEQYPEKVRYQCIGSDQKEYEVAGNAALSKRIKRTDIGCIIKFHFLGMVQGQRNKYKNIEVAICPRHKTPEGLIERFPRWHDFANEVDDARNVRPDSGAGTPGTAPPEL